MSTVWCATEFRKPIGDGLSTSQNDGDGYYVAFGFDEQNPAVGSYHLGRNWNVERSAGTDLFSRNRNRNCIWHLEASPGSLFWAEVSVVRGRMDVSTGAKAVDAETSRTKAPNRAMPRPTRANLSVLNRTMFRFWEAQS